MARVSLRAYVHEIEGLIEQGHRLDEAIAHCRQILTSYPKHLDTYRLLGKAYLEAKRYDQAVDIFQRVLVAAPEDFVAHVGMSIIADDQGKLDDAIWHMERAFEVQPSNAAIQAELQRLFGRRDGVEPPKIRLTRGALAHMYVQGELYTQAISEIRAVLGHDPNRPDLQVLLARAYFRNGQKAEAADTCAALLAISPYCLDANRFMAEIAPGMQADDAAQEYRRRVFELDPYAEFAQGSIFNTEAVPEGAVSLQRLDYTASMPVVAPALGIGVGPAAEEAEPALAPPSWLTSTPAPETGSTEVEESQESVPDFMREAGWHEVAPGTPEAESIAEEEDVEPAAPSGNLPEWVRALAPSEEAEHPQPTEPSEWKAPEWARAGETDLSGSNVEPAAAGIDSTPDWLKDLAMDAERLAGVSGEDVPEPLPFTPRQTRELEPAAGPTAAPNQDDALAWLEGLAEKHGAKPEELLTPPGARPSAPPDWVDRAQREARDDQGAARLDSSGPMPSDDSRRAPQPPAEAAGGKPFDWLSGLSDQNTYSEMEQQPGSEQPAIMEEREATISPEPPSVGQSGSLPDWLAGSQPARAERTGAEREASKEAEPAVSLPEWLADLDKKKPEVAAAAPIEEPPATLPDWLKPEPPEGSPRQVTSSDRTAEPTPTPEVPAVDAMKPPSRKYTSEAAPPEIGRASAVSRPPAEREKPAARTRPASGDMVTVTPSLGGAKTQLGRGNIAAALDEYGRLIRKGRGLEEIIRDLRDALYRYPVEVPLWQALGDAYMRANRLQEALDAYTKAEELLR